MNLDAVDIKDLDRWLVQPTSQLWCHEANCCLIAKQWLISMGRSFDFSVTENQRYNGPSWLAKKFKWGANPWPLHWCEAVSRDSIDCGVFSVFAQEIFRAKGIECYPGQVIQYVGTNHTLHAQGKWTVLEGSFKWIGNGFNYHEINIVRTEFRGVQIYDPTEGLWLNPARVQSLGAPIAIRSEAGVVLNWEEYRLHPDQWTEVYRK